VWVKCVNSPGGPCTSLTLRYESLRTHPFFESVNFSTLSESTPPAISEQIPKENTPNSCWERDPNMERGAGRIGRLLIEGNASSDEELGE
jgi:hypothetical protein